MPSVGGLILFVNYAQNYSDLANNSLDVFVKFDIFLKKGSLFRILMRTTGSFKSTNMIIPIDYFIEVILIDFIEKEDIQLYSVLEKCEHEFNLEKRSMCTIYEWGL